MSTATAVAVRERPILFSSPMIRAILDGRKTQTRRVMKPQPRLHSCEGGWPGRVDPMADGTWSVLCHACGWDGCWRCPYGVPGDRLWVRETWLYVGPGSGSDLPEYEIERARPENHSPSNCWYRADPSWDSGDPASLKWAPSIFMPRWASRLTLEIAEVRVQRLQEISEDDARAEGVEVRYEEGRKIVWARDVFAELWDSINGQRAPWSINPWVWAISFKKLRP